MPELAKKLGDEFLVNKAVIAEDVINIVKIRAVRNNNGNGFCAVALFKNKNVIDC